MGWQRVANTCRAKLDCQTLESGNVYLDLLQKFPLEPKSSLSPPSSLLSVSESIMAGPDSSHGVSRVVHHKDFYLRGGDMTVLVSPDVVAFLTGR
jgi:hypothetical protein